MLDKASVPSEFPGGKKLATMMGHDSTNMASAGLSESGGAPRNPHGGKHQRGETQDVC